MTKANVITRKRNASKVQAVNVQASVDTTDTATVQTQTSPVDTAAVDTAAVDTATVTESNPVDCFTKEAFKESASLIAAAAAIKTAKKAKDSTNNQLASATIRVKDRLTLTSLLDSVVSVAASKTDRVTAEQLERFVALSTGYLKFHYSRESSNIARLLNHCSQAPALKSSCDVDKASHVIMFKASFRALCSNPAYIKQCESILAAHKAASEANNFTFPLK